MELSPFNVVVENGADEYLVFNTLRSSLVVLSADAYSDLEAGGKQFSEAFLNAGIMTHNAQADYDLQRKQFDKDVRSKDLLALCIAPSYDCNLACTYCYEKNQSISGAMTPEILDRIFWFVGEIYQRDHFKYLHVQWYGGEPVISIDTIESLSAKLIAFCDARGIAYGAELISNTTLIDQEKAVRLAASRVTTTMAALAGCKQLHDCRRPKRGGQGSFDEAVQGILNLRDAGVQVNVTVNMDKKTLDDYRSLRKRFAGEGVAVTPTPIQDYTDDLSANAHIAKSENESTNLDVYTREEYSWLTYELFKEEGYNAQSLKRSLGVIRNFCRGQLENYFVIDAPGDVYKCDGRMGYKEYALFNINDDIDVETLSTINYNPFDDQLCKTCAILPICKGQCAWDRATQEDGSHPLLYTIHAYIKDYRSCFEDVEKPVSVLVEPTNLDQLYANPVIGDGLTFAIYASAPSE